MQPSADCYNIIKRFEGLVLTAYRDKVGIWTIGYGNTFYEGGKPVKMGDKITKSRAEQLLQFVVKDFSKHVSSLVKAPLRQSQFDALVSFAYNVGLDIDADPVAEGLGDSTLLKMINANPGNPMIRAEFLKWNKITVNGRKVVLDGLTRRRRAEGNLYFRDRTITKTTDS